MKTQADRSNLKVNGYGVLRSILEDAREQIGCDLGSLTVLSAQVDPYRLAGKAARWLGYIPFERISDNRNAEPFIHHKASLVSVAKCPVFAGTYQLCR
jgi:hypothetical protein